jgi:hypothetical protein
MRGSRRTTKNAGSGSAVRGLARATKKLRRETSLGSNAAMAELLAGTRIHSDPQSAQEADALGAAAFTRGGEIFVGSAAPPLDSIGGVELLRHELAHVVQQAKAHGRTGQPINQAGDAFEVAADNGSAAPAGAPPAIQRQWANPKLAHFPEKVDVLKKFFEDLKARGRGNLNVGLDEAAKLKLRELAQAPDPEFKGPPPDPKITTRVTALDLLFNAPHPTDPGELAVKVANILPVSMDPAVLKRLRPLDVTEQPKGFGKLLETVEKTTPNPSPNLPEPANEQKRDEAARQQDIGEKQSPLLPVGQIPDIVGEMKKPPPPKAAPRPAEQPKPAAQPEQQATPPPGTTPQPAAQPDVITGASPIVPAAPAPAQQGLGALPSYVDSAILQAQGQSKATADLMLGETLKAQQDTVFGQVQHLLQMHAGDKAFKVTAVNVYFGGKLARTVRLGAK